ncbi:MAG: hypothetical protein KDG50_15990 [Chromatiales bacterium]|nr:hypothetical protein [Chromatiales bacterium]
MKRILALAVLSLAFFAPGAWAVTTYTYVSPSYDTITNYTPACGGGDCQNYLPGMNLSGSVKMTAPPAPNLVGADITPQVVSWSFSDGLKTIRSSDASARLESPFIVWTDAEGNILAMDFQVQAWQTGAGPHMAGDRYGIISSFFISTFVLHNGTCSTVGVSGAGDADSCIGDTFLPDERSEATSELGVWTAFPHQVPALAAWGVLALGALLGIVGFSARRRS